MRIRSRIKDWRRRRLLERHGIAPEISVPVHRSGMRSGTWSVVPDRLGPLSTVYSVGVGDNIAWELDLIASFDVTVHAFDPTPESVAWIEGQRLPEAFRFYPTGLAAHDGLARFQRPKKPGRFDYVPDHGQQMQRGSFIECPVRTLSSLRSHLGHDHIDLLKLDIEGGEYAALADVITELPGQLLIEFHHDLPSIGFARTLTALSALRSAGYRIFDISRRGLEFAFLRP